MKRSEINEIIRGAEATLAEHRFYLPPFAAWTADDWRQKGPEASEIVDNDLGWDITDFGQDDFDRCGLALFTIRNGRPENVQTGSGKTYCEKIIVLRQGQRCPSHTHYVKIEDLINRSASPLTLVLHQAGEDGAPSDAPVVLSMDGVVRTFDAGSAVTLNAGESVTLVPGCYHELIAEAGDVVIGEVSVVNDDRADNRFKEPVGRFPEIDEDAPPYRLLLQDYPKHYRRR